jgi:hypothetical protein
MSGNDDAAAAEFAEFEKSGNIETRTSEEPEAKPEKKGGGSGRPPREAVERVVDGIEQTDDENEGGDEGEDAGEGEGEDGGEEKPQKTAKDHQIERLKREKAALNRRLRALEMGGTSTAQNQGLPAGNGGDTKPAEVPAPDPTDTAKYPLGHLDDRYIEDKATWLIDKRLAERADTALQREQENELTRSAEQQTAALLEKVEEVSAKGSELFEDFEETVVQAGMRGDYALGQTTFEAAAEAENGAQILYDLSQDPKEAKRVANLSPLNQLKFVQERDAELTAKSKGRTKPKAGEPPKNLPRGANSKTQINPATDNLDDFEKAWEQDAKRSSR